MAPGKKRTRGPSVAIPAASAGIGYKKHDNGLASIFLPEQVQKYIKREKGCVVYVVNDIEYKVEISSWNSPDVEISKQITDGTTVVEVTLPLLQLITFDNIDTLIFVGDATVATFLDFVRVLPELLPRLAKDFLASIEAVETPVGTEGMTFF